jgi:hypothetical protein
MTAMSLAKLLDDDENTGVNKHENTSTCEGGTVVDFSSVL